MTFSLASLFTDHMVLQQAKAVPVWGKAPAGARITVQFAGQTAQTSADTYGKWSLTLQPLGASREGRELVARCVEPQSSAAPRTLTFRDVVVGEVWLCSGQSNMQMQVRRVINADEEIKAGDYPLLRLFEVPRRVSDTPLESLHQGGWVACSPETAGDFSAVGYFFGREIHRRLDVPVGLVSSSWGGTRIEAWTSREGLLAGGAADSSVAELVHAFDRVQPTLGQVYEEWQKACAVLDEKHRDVHNLGYEKGWAGASETTDVTWADMTLPNYWQSVGLAFNGILWFRKEVILPAAWAGKELELSIGAADKSDITYFNNQQVGSLTMADSPDAWNTHRKYRVDGSLVKPGANVVAVRVHSDKFAGGLHGPAGMMYISCPSLPDQKRVGIDGTWRYAVEANYGQVVVPPDPMGPESPHAPARLHNGMLRPLAPFALRGVIWYQGESNATRGVQYRTLSPLLISDIRRHWQDQDVAFHLVQLANFRNQSPQPAESDWAMLREAQAMTLATPGTGMAVAIDIGESNDIHPRNKQDVGLRLAHSALHITYGQKDILPGGPTLKKSTVQGDSIRLDFDHTGNRLVAKDGHLIGFAIAGSDKKFVWADAKIQGDSVRVSSPQIPRPQYVRYAWDDNPSSSLYNVAGLPASPFRTDRD